MGELAFISSLVGELAWPVAAVALGLIFRKQLRAVFASLAKRMEHLVKLKAPGTELSFSDELIAARSELAQVRTTAALPATDLLTDTAEDEPQGSYYTDNWGGADARAEREAAAAAAIAKLEALERERRSDGSDLRKNSWFAPKAGDRSQLFSDSQVPRVVSMFRDGAIRRVPRLRLNNENLADQAEAQPELVVLSAWEYLLAALTQFAALRGMPLPFPAGDRALAAVAELSESGYGPIPPEAEQVVQRLLTLRNGVRDGALVTKLEAYDYAVTALELADVFIAATPGSAPPARQAPDKTGAP